MFCPNCGEPVAEGKSFCKNCGAPVAIAASIPAAAGEAASAATVVMGGAVADDSAPLPPIAEAHKVVPPPATTFVASTPPPPPPDRSNVAPLPPPPVYSGYDQLQPSQGKGGRTGLLIGIVIAAIIVLAGAGVAAFLLLRDGDASVSVTTAVQSSSTTTLPPTTTTAVTGSSTTATTAAPSTTSTSAAASSTTVDPVQQYLMATDAMVQLLTGNDARIPVLADQINATAPNVPRGVYNELQVMMGKLDGAFTEMADLTVPTGFEESNTWFDEAVRYMGERIYATIQGIEAMYDAGSTSSATAYFEQGRIARDNYRTAFQKFQESVPID